ncbi:MAG: carbon-nitrogen hydrolase family protein [Thermoguttaceae bacterium]|jgi:predicted amidohydrolase
MNSGRLVHAIWAFKVATCLAALGIVGGTADRARAADNAAAGPVVVERCETWAPEALAAPLTGRTTGGEVTVAGNGTHICCGGWQFVYGGVRGGQAYRFRARVRHEGLDHARDSLVAIVLWDRWDRTQAGSPGRLWNYLLPRPVSADAMEFEALLKAPPGTTSMTVRYTLRWSPGGKSRWSAPQIDAAAVAERKPVKVCVVSETRQSAERIAIQPFSKGTELPRDVAGRVDRWASLVQAACRRQPQLIVTPEIVISGPGLVEGAVAVPGPAIAPFQKLAREHHAHLVLGVKERTGGAVYNSAVLIGAEGQIVGTYRKVHLATSEGFSGLSPGDSFGVFDTAIGRIGCLICMDTTVSESARMLALGGAEFICFPIMGDLRADRFTAGEPIFNESRWKAIMRTRAIDNQLCMVVARNGAQGSCIIDRKGEILAWNEGDREIIEATLPAEDGYRVWEGGDFRETTFLLRRPHLYRAYSDEACLGLPPPPAGPTAPSAK